MTWFVRQPQHNKETRMSDCPRCTPEEYCSDACADADEPCLHGELELLAYEGGGISEICQCLDCGEVVRHYVVTT